MKRACVGVHVHAEPERLRTTLDSLLAHTPPGVEILLLPDGPDAATGAALARLSDFPQSGTAAPRGAPACFNRLAALSDADVLVLLESGARVAPSWLEHLLAALDEDSRNGLAGPTTNRSWNEQGVYPYAGATTTEIARTAAEACARFGREARTLAPLHSLADFCYAVRREVVWAVGAADETYGAGPCWEMDYNVRAARAGFRGVWACASYVHRAPCTARRLLDDARRFETNKRLYQDKFCGARLRGEKTDYRDHCRGDACTNFAPARLIEINRPLHERATAETTGANTLPPRPVLLGSLGAVTRAPRVPGADIRGGGTLNASTRRTSTRRANRLDAETLDANTLGANTLGPRPYAQSLGEQTDGEAPDCPPHIFTDGDGSRVQSVERSLPLVTCIMPTCDRRRFVPQAIRYFLRQDYPHKELLILDDGEDAIGDLVPEDARLRYVRLERRLSIGAKRNAACELARGEIVVHWDDDDWYPRWRVGAQARALLEHESDVSGTSRLYYFDAAAERAWVYRYAAAGSPWVAGNTLAYRKSFWERNRFPDVQVGEDSLFIWNVASKVIHDLDDPRLCVASVHPDNTSPKETGGMFWQPRPAGEVRALLGDDVHLYRALSPPADGGGWPLVSCIMPTYNRRAFIPLAVRNFFEQDYPRKELLIVDDGEDAVGDLVEGLAGVTYKRLVGRATIGTKRNLACELARGEVIAHWDDDDWYAPERLRYQVRPLLGDEAHLTGLESSFVLELPGGAFWTTQPQLHRRMFVGDVHGGTLVYRRDLLADDLRYPEVSLAEDAWLLHLAVSRGRRLTRLPNPGLFVYVRHGHNAWGEFEPGSFISPSGWHRIAPPHAFSLKHLELYRTAAASL